METPKVKGISGKKVMGAFFVVCLVVTAILWGSLTETVERGTYDIIQYPFTGTNEAKMDPGMYPQLFGSIEPWNVSETFYFTSDSDEGANSDESIEVRFNDGSVSFISGTLRIDMPRSEVHAVELMTVHGYKSYNDLEHRLVLPVVRKSLRASANLMNARESYATRRTDFIAMTWDQIENGVYLLVDAEKIIEDPEDATKTITKVIKVIKEDKDGNIVREHNPLEGKGLILANFEVKKFNYDTKVLAQISKQQENLMAIETARAEAERAQQDAITKEAKGKAAVMEVKYAQLQVKEKATIIADQDKVVAETHALKKLEVAKLEKKAAAELKQKLILEGQGEAEKKKLIMGADGALKQKLAAAVQMNKDNAAALAKRAVPTNYWAASGGSGNGAGSYDDEMVRQLRLMNLNTVKSLNLDMTIAKKK